MATAAPPGASLEGTLASADDDGVNVLALAYGVLGVEAVATAFAKPSALPLLRAAVSGSCGGVPSRAKAERRVAVRQTGATSTVRGGAFSSLFVLHLNAADT